MTTRTPALIFDFGNVVAHFDYHRACETLGRPLGLGGEAFLSRARGLGLTPLVQRYERGEIPSEEFSRAFCTMAGVEVGHDDFAAAWTDIFWPNEAIAPVIAGLKRRGYTLVLGSNTNDLHASRFRRQFAETLADFDRLVLSHEIGHIKPSAAFYLACAEAAGASTSDCLFIDDLAENVEGARAAGLAAVVYRDVPALLVDLRRHGVEVDDDGPRP